MRNRLTPFSLDPICVRYGITFLPSSSRCQHPRIVLRHDIIHLFCQFTTLKSDVRGSFLEVTYTEQIIFVDILRRVVPNMLHQPYSDITTVVRYRFTIQQKQHSFQVYQLISPPAPVQTKSPAVMRNLIVDDDFLTEVAGTVGFVIPRQAFEDADDATFKDIHFVQMDCPAPAAVPVT